MEDERLLHPICPLLMEIIRGDKGVKSKWWKRSYRAFFRQMFGLLDIQLIPSRTLPEGLVKSCFLGGSTYCQCKNNKNIWRTRVENCSSENSSFSRRRAKIKKDFHRFSYVKLSIGVKSHNFNHFSTRIMVKKDWMRKYLSKKVVLIISLHWKLKLYSVNRYASSICLATALRRVLWGQKLRLQKSKKWQI